MIPTKNNEALFEQFNAYMEGRDKNFELLLTDQELQTIFGISRMTLYRARRSGKLPYENGFGGQIVYRFENVLLAVKTNRFMIRGLTKFDAIERLETFKKILEL